MEYQKITNLLDNGSNQSPEFRTINWVEIKDESREGHNVDTQIKFKTTMFKSSLCDYSDSCILVKGTVAVDDISALGAAPNNTNKKVIFKNYAPFANCISEIDNTQVGSAKDLI